MNKTKLLLLSLLLSIFSFAQITDTDYDTSFNENFYNKENMTRRPPVIGGIKPPPQAPLSYYIEQVLNPYCYASISTIEQIPSFLMTGYSQCFSHDHAGNLTESDDCHPVYSYSVGSFSVDELEIIQTRVQLYPNPTSSWITISWDGESAELISHMKVVSLLTDYYVEVPVSIVNYTAKVDLSLQPKGIYLLIIALKSGKSFTKNIMKL